MFKNLFSDPFNKPQPSESRRDRQSRNRSRTLRRQLRGQLLESRQMMAADSGWTISGGDSQAQYFDDGAVTDDGSLIVAVDYRGSIDVAPNENFSDGSDVLTAPEGGKSDAIIKYDSQGSLQWTKPFEVLAFDGTRGGVRVDGAQYEAGGFYVTGRIDGIVDLEPENPNSDSIVDSVGFTYGVAFAARFDAESGALDWVHEVGATSGSGLSSYYVDHELAVDRAGNAYFAFAAGAFNTSLSANNLPMYFSGQQLGNPEGFYQRTYIATIDVDGQVDRFQRLGSFEAFDDVQLAVDDRASDPADWRLIVAGSAGGKVHLGDASSLAQESTIGTPNSNLSDERGFYDADVVLVSLSTSGAVDWTGFYEGSLRQSSADLAIDSTGTIYFRGYTGRWGDSTPNQSPLQFDPSNSNSVLDGFGAFIATFEPNGSFVAADFAAGLSDSGIVGTTDDGVLLFVNGRRAHAVGGLLLEDTSLGDQYIVELNRELKGTALLSHESDLKGFAVNDSGRATAWGSFTPDETLPNGSEPTALGIDAYAVSFDLGDPLTLPTAQLSTAFSDSFETGSTSNDWVGNWTEDSQNDWFRSSQRSWAGNRAAEVDGSANNAALTSKAIDLSEYASADLTFNWYIESGFDTGEYLAADVWNGTEWIEISRIKGNESTENLWLKRTEKLTPDLLNADFRVRFRAQVSSSREDANVDDVRIVGVLPTGAPNQSPVADAGGTYAMDEGASITLDGRQSQDPDGTIVRYEWDIDGDGQFDDAVGATPTFTTTQSGSASVGLRVTDNDGATSTSSATVAVSNVAPTAAAGGTYQAEVGDTLWLSAAGSTDPGQDIVTYQWDLDGNGSFETEGISVQFDTSSVGTTTVGLRVIDQDGESDTDTASVEISESSQPAGPNLSHGTAEVGSEWTTIQLDHSYESMVVVATPRYNDGSGPGIARVRNATGNRFEVRVEGVGTTAFSGGIHYVVVEEGIYDEPGFKFEAVKRDSSQTSGKRSSWLIDSVPFAQSYVSPVVVGQVMTANDADWSVFWSSSSSRTSPATSGALNVGKHVGEDPDTTRATETIGYLVIEATQNGTVEGLPFVAGVGSDSIRGVENGSYRYSYDAMPNSKTVVLSSAGMDGGDGSWPVLLGSNPLPPSSGTIDLAVDEDQLSDSERKHTTEQVAYFVIDPPLTDMADTTSEIPVDAPSPATVDLNGDGRVTAGDALQLINRLNRDDRSTDIASFDTNGDGKLTVADALYVINRIGQETAESESGDLFGLPAAEVDQFFADLDD